MNVDYNTYEGMEVQGIAEVVISRGRVVVEDNVWHAGPAGVTSSSEACSAGRSRQRSWLPRRPPECRPEGRRTDRYGEAV